MATETEQSAEIKAEAKAEVSEIKADIEETKAEAKEARADGDTDRAARLEEKVGALETALNGRLDKLTASLDALVKRPFHPAPEERPAEEKQDQGTTETPAADPADDKPKPKRRTANRGWFGSRVDED